MSDIERLVSDEYIRGLTDGERTFTFHTLPRLTINSLGESKRLKMPAFAIRMHERDWNLLDLVRISLDLKGKVYRHKPYRYDKYGCRNTAAQVSLIVRDVLELRNIIIPLFYKKLHGYKGKQFINWLEKMGDEEMTTESRYLHRLYKSGHFDKEKKHS